MGSPDDRLYDLLPAVYRVRDASQGYALRALLAVMERELDRVEGDIEQLYRNWFVETCQEWLVPYIGDLLSVRGLQAYGTDAFSLRPYVANTLAYRRRKGTANVLEQLARDVTGWRARVVEFFQLLATSQHVNHVRLHNHRAPDLRDANRLAYVDGPFDTTAHTADVRRIATMGGKHNIPNVGLYLWRLQSYHIAQVAAAPAADPADGRYFFNPLGADLALFNRPQTETEIAHLAEEINVPIELRRRALYDDLNALREGKPEGGRYFGSQPALQVYANGDEVSPEQIFICDLSDQEQASGGINWRRPEAAGQTPPNVFVDPKLGRLSFAPDETPTTVAVSYAYGFSDDTGGGPYNRQASVEDWFKRFEKPEVAGEDFKLWQIGVTKNTALHSAPNSHSPVVGTLAEAINLWNAISTGKANAFGIIALMDNASYVEDLTGEAALIKIPGGARLAIVAADWPETGERLEGVLRRQEERVVPQNRRPHVDVDLFVKGTEEGEMDPGELVLDGLLVEGKVTVRSGNLGILQIAHCTLGATAERLAPGLEVEALGSKPDSASNSVSNNSRLAITIDHSIVGPIILPDSVPALRISDSVVGEDRTAQGEAETAEADGTIEALDANTTIARCTVFGITRVRTLNADNSIFTAEVETARRQEGCVRFCYVPPGSRTPRRYRCQPDFALTTLAKASGLESAADLDAKEVQLLYARLRPDFTSSRYGEAAFAQLGRSCAAEIRTGADDGAEMGVFNSLKQPQREANLRSALDEYLRVGLEAGIFFVT